MTVQEPLNASQRAKLSVDDFLTLSKRGAFERYARSELIEGEIWVVNAVHRRHARAQALLTVELGIALRASGSALGLYSTPSTHFSATSLPEPDIVLAEQGRGKLVAGSSVRLAVEISDSTLEMDLNRKARLYAEHLVPEYWVIDLGAKRIHQMWEPHDYAYSERRQLPFGASVKAATIADLAIETVGLG